MNTQIILKSHKDEPLRRRHPWVFSGAINRIEGRQPEDGDLVEVWSSTRNFLGLGHYHAGSIAVRVLAFEPLVIDADFWQERTQSALKLRHILLKGTDTNAYRLIHGEGDGCSGLIVDVYGDVAVLQAHSIGMHRAKNEIAEGLKRAFLAENLPLSGIYDKSAATLPRQYAATAAKDGYLWRENAETEPNYTQIIRENSLQFEVNWQTGQKTGFFLDQRDNRALVQRYAAGKTLLNAFCYSGGFSIYALAAGAKNVISVDVSDKAIGLVERNVEINGFGSDRHQSVQEDVQNYLKSAEPQDILILDPPAFAKTLDKRHQAVQGYKRLNAAGMQRIKPEGGLLFTFSCSQVVDMPLFYQTVVAAGIESGRQIRVLHQLSQAADHPINLFHPESSYLKGLVLYVE